MDVDGRALGSPSCCSPPLACDTLTCALCPPCQMFEYVLDFLRAKRFAEGPGAAASALPRDERTLCLLAREAAFYRLPELAERAERARAALAAASGEEGGSGAIAGAGRAFPGLSVLRLHRGRLNATLDATLTHPGPPHPSCRHPLQHSAGRLRPWRSAGAAAPGAGAQRRHRRGRCCSGLCRPHRARCPLP